MTTPWPAPTPTEPVSTYPLVRWWRRLTWFNKLMFALALVPVVLFAVRSSAWW